MQIAPQKLIIVRLSGGLGNQLFQYGLAKSLEALSGARVLLDTGYLDSAQTGVTKRTFLLDKFSITLPLARPEDLRRIGIPELQQEDVLSKLRRKIFLIQELFRPKTKKKMIMDTEFTFTPSVLEVKGDAYVSGNWVSSRYFEDIRPTLIRDLTLADTPSSAYEAVRNDIDRSVSVAVHVRRGDYLKYPKFAICPPEYYRKAVDYLNAKLSNPSYFVFSDDIDYVREHIDFGERVSYVSNGSIPDYEELMLMSSCRHSIIANSSFSWWAAWLNRYADKIVIAPLLWRTNDTDISDYVPSYLGWLRM